MRGWLLVSALALACKGDEAPPAPATPPQPVPPPPPAEPDKSCRVETLEGDAKRVVVEHLGIEITLPPLDWVIDCQQPALAAVRMEQFGILVRAERHTETDAAAAVAEGLEGIVGAWSEGGAFAPGPRQVSAGEDGRARACVSGPGKLDGAPHHMQACATGTGGDDGTTVVYVSMFVRAQAWDPAAEDAEMLLEIVDAIATDWKRETG